MIWRQRQNTPAEPRLEASIAEASIARRTALSTVLLSAAAVAAPTGVVWARDGRYDSGQDDRRFEDPGPIRVSAQTSARSRFLPTALAVTGPAPGGGAPLTLVASLPRRAPATRVDRLDLSGVPLAGGLFRPRPATAAIEPDRRVGSLFRVGDTLVAQLDAWAPRAWSEASVALVSRAPFSRNPIAFRFEPAYRAAAAPAGPAAEIGGVYADRGDLVLAPPRAWLTGYDLQ